MEDILIKIGGFGRYQVFLMSVVFLTTFTCALNYYTQVFSLLEPPKSCSDKGKNRGDVCGYETLNGSFSRCASWNYNYSEQFPTVVSEANWVCEKDEYPKYIFTVFWIGNAVGCVLFGLMSDRFGRKPTVLVSHLIYLVGNFSSLLFTTSLYFQIMVRMFIGISHHVISHLPYLLAVEYCTESTRVIPLMTMLISYTIGSIFAPLYSAYFVSHWSQLVIISALPNFVILMCYPILPESSAWLACKGQWEKVKETLNFLRKTNGISNNGSEEQVKNVILEYIKAQKLKKDSLPKAASFVSFKYSRLLLHFLFAVIICVCCFMCYYGHVRNTANLGNNVYSSFILGSLVEIGAWCVPIVINHLGRRWVLTFLLLSSGICGVSYGLIPDKFFGIQMGTALFGRIFITGAYYIALQFASEIFPTEIRGKGVAACEFLGGLGIIVSPFIVHLDKYGKGLPLATFGLISVLGAVVTTLLPETANQKLIHTLQEGNDFGRDQNFFYCICGCDKSESPTGISFDDVGPEKKPLKCNDGAT